MVICCKWFRSAAKPCSFAVYLKSCSIRSAWSLHDTLLDFFSVRRYVCMISFASSALQCSCLIKAEIARLYPFSVCGYPCLVKDLHLVWASTERHRPRYLMYLVADRSRSSAAFWKASSVCRSSSSPPLSVKRGTLTLSEWSLES